MFVVVRLIDACNLECKMCDFVDRDRESYGKTMTLAEYKILLENLQNAYYRGRRIDTIRLDGNREGLLYPNIVEAVEETKKAGFRAQLVTNGVLLSKELSCELLKKGLDSINFSISGITWETYSKYQGYKRNRQQLLTVMENIKSFVECRKKLNSNAYVCVSMLANDMNKNNLNEFRDAILLYKKIGVNGVLFGNDYQMINGRKKSNVGNCATVPIIDVHGCVYPCCGGLEKDNIVLGNIFTTKGKDIFEGDRALKLFKNLCKLNIGDTDISLPEGCENCIYFGTPQRKSETVYSFDVNHKVIAHSRIDEGTCVYIFGLNHYAKDLIDHNVIECAGIIDNDIYKWGNYNGVQVGGVADFKIHDEDIILICTRNVDEAMVILKDIKAEKGALLFNMEYLSKKYPILSVTYLLN